MRNLSCILFFGMIFLFGFEACQKDDLSIQHDREEVIVRKIGHEILLHFTQNTIIFTVFFYNK